MDVLLTNTRSMLTALLMLYRVRGAILIGIFLVSIISWPRSTPFTLFPDTAKGDAAFDFFKKVVAFKPLHKVGNAIDVSGRPTSKDPFLTALVVWCLSKRKSMVRFSHHPLCGYSR